MEIVILFVLFVIGAVGGTIQAMRYLERRSDMCQAHSSVDADDKK